MATGTDEPAKKENEMKAKFSEIVGIDCPTGKIEMAAEVFKSHVPKVLAFFAEKGIDRMSYRIIPSPTFKFEHSIQFCDELWWINDDGLHISSFKKGVSDEDEEGNQIHWFFGYRRNLGKWLTIEFDDELEED